MDLTLTKGPSRKTLKARKDRAEDKVKKAVRAHCVDRDGCCRVETGHYGAIFAVDAIDGDVVNVFDASSCEGISQHAHMHHKRRSKTMGMAPEVRHTTHDSLMLCQKHHDQYDGRATPRLRITALTRKGADGPLKFTRATS